MKTRNYFSAMASLLVLAMSTLVACSTEDDDIDSVTNSVFSFAYSADSDGSGDGEGGGNSEGNTQAGIVTAGEWNDLDHWGFWSALMRSDEFKDKSDYWQFYTNNRVAVRITDADDNALAGVRVKLARETGGKETTLWEAVTDNHGLAECWVGLSQREEAKAEGLTISLNGKKMDGHPSVTAWDAELQSAAVNHYTIARGESPKQQADIAFIVDATGSMHDEINFLKSDLRDIIGKVKSIRPEMTMRTAALFYRDEGDDYLTRHSNFTTDLSTTDKFIGQQKAEGGGDYPEAVHTALERTLQDLAWDATARTRLAFLVLDAPAHHETAIIRSLQQSIARFAQQGIRLVPVAASGADKNTEFMLRFFAVSTGGTYVFLTDDSGVGNEHIAASVGEYEVEQLNSLIVRLISKYTE